MEKDMIIQLHKRFEEYAYEQDGIEYWLARELQELLEYTQWRNFENVISKAKIACEKSGNPVTEHFAEISKTIQMPKGATKEVHDYMLTRYACYLIAQNGDPKKVQIAFAQSYFAIQTRKHELLEERIHLMERLQAREKLADPKQNFQKSSMKGELTIRGFHALEAKVIGHCLGEIIRVI